MLIELRAEIGSSVFVKNLVCDAVKLGRFAEHLSGQSFCFLRNSSVDCLVDNFLIS